MALPTLPTTIRMTKGVFFGEFVTVLAVSLHCSIGPRASAPDNVRPMANHFHVIRVAASSISAQMVQLFIDGDGTDKMFVHNAVDQPVAAVILAHPVPAIASTVIF